MPVRRLGAGHDQTCERAYSGYEIANIIRLFRMQKKTEKCNLNIKHLTQSRSSAKILILLSWYGGFYMNPFNAYNFLLLYV